MRFPQQSLPQMEYFLNQVAKMSTLWRGECVCDGRGSGLPCRLKQKLGEERVLPFVGGLVLGHTHDKRQGCNFQVPTVTRTYDIT